MKMPNKSAVMISKEMHLPNDVCNVCCVLQHVAQPSAAVCAKALCVTRLQRPDDTTTNTGIVSTLPTAKCPDKNGTSWKSHVRRAMRVGYPRQTETRLVPLRDTGEIWGHSEQASAGWAWTTLRGHKAHPLRPDLVFSPAP